MGIRIRDGEIDLEAGKRVDGVDLSAVIGPTLTLADITDITALAAEVNQLGGVAAGVAAASKVAVLGANKNLDEFHTAALYLGAAAGTLLTPTAAEINVLAAVIAGTAKASAAVVLDASLRINVWDATAYKVGGVAGVDYGPAAPTAGFKCVKGIVTVG